MKVYVVLEIVYDDRSVIGVYATHEAAQAAVDGRPADGWHAHEIEEHEVRS